MPLYMGCKRCGRTVHASKAGKFCPDCGGKLSSCTDTREITDGNEQKQKEYREYLRLKEKFES